jgi:4-hydroxy-tetrahydrodipicolinate synthase
MNASIFRGVGVALVTPFTTTGAIDFSSLEKIVNYVIDNGVDYLVALGTTSEAPTLTFEEKVEVLQCIKKANNKRKPLVCGIGGYDTADVIKSFNKFPLEDMDAILSVSPFYNKPSQEGIYQHFVALNAATPLPIIAYNVPGRTGTNMSAATIVRIAKDCNNIIAIKDACGNVVQNMEVVKNAPTDFVVLSGDDDIVLPQIAVGVQGVISVAANCFTKDFCGMVHKALEGNYTDARQTAMQYMEGINLLFAEGNPSGVKYVMSKMGLCENNFRLPVVSVSESCKSNIDSFLKK